MISASPSADVAPRPGRFATVFAFASGSTARQGSTALVDQAFVSGTRFFTTLLVGRIAGPAELGTYSMLFAIMLLVIVIQEALLTTPYTVYANRLRGVERAGYAGGVFAHYLMLSGAAMIGLLLVAVMIRLWGTESSAVTSVIWVLAAVVPFVLLREIARRFAFAHLRLAVALKIDATVSVVQIAALLLLAWQGALSAATAYVAVGLGCGVSGAMWFTASRNGLLIRRQHVSAAWRQNWKFGRWVCAGQIGSVVHTYVMIWVLAILLGPVAAGVYAAAESLVLFSNPIILGVNSLLDPKTARGFASGGHEELNRLVKKGMAVLGGFLVAFVGLLLLFGSSALVLLYGDQYVGQGWVIVVLGLATLVGAVGVPLSSGLRAVERPDANFRARMAGLGTTLVAAIPLVMLWGGIGAALAMVAGAGTHLALKWIVFAKLVSRVAKAGITA